MFRNCWGALASEEVQCGGLAVRGASLGTRLSHHERSEVELQMAGEWEL